MARASGPGRGAAEALGRALVHLRLPFSLVLTPLFVWGVYLASPRPLPWLHLLLAYLIVHGPLYGGMNAFNSYYDRDEGPIGALADPPPVDRTVLVVALLCKAVAVAAGLWLDVRFGLLVAVAAVVFSVGYSHPRWRWKERPALAAAAVFAFQGVLGVLWGFTAATLVPGTPLPLWTVWPAGWTGTVGVLGAATWTLGFYPLTGVYQIAADRRRGVRTLATALGLDGCFLFAAAVAPVGALGMGLVLLAREAYPAVAASVVYTAGAAVYAWRWRRRFEACTPRQNQQALMRLSYANGAVFTGIFLALTVWPSGRDTREGSRELPIPALARNNMANASPGVGDVAREARDQVNMHMADSLTGGAAHVDADVVAGWAQGTFQAILDPAQQVVNSPDLLGGQVEETGGVPAGDDQRVPG